MIQLYKIFQKKMVDPFQMEIAQQRKRNGENKTKTKRWLLNCFCVCLSVCLSIGVYRRLPRGLSFIIAFSEREI
jgi:hypothetical protein